MGSDYFGSRSPLFTPRSCGLYDGFKHFTAASPFQYLIISITDGTSWVRLEFIFYNHHHTLTFESWLVTIFAPADLYFSHQDHVILDWFKHFTAASPFQYSHICIMDGSSWVRLEFILYKYQNTLTFESWVVNILAPDLFFSHQDHVIFGLIQAFHSSFTLSIYHHTYNGWFPMGEIGIHTL